MTRTYTDAEKAALLQRYDKEVKEAAENAASMIAVLMDLRSGTATDEVWGKIQQYVDYCDTLEGKEGSKH